MDLPAPSRRAFTRRHVAPLAALLSTAAHVLAAASLAQAPAAARERVPVPHEIALIEAPREKALPVPPKQPEPPAPEPEPTPPPPPRLDREPPPAAPLPEEDPYAGAPPLVAPPASEPAATGPAILAAEHGGWTLHGGGTGSAGTGGRGDGRGPAPAPAAPPRPPPAERVVALGDLSRAPAPPSLDGALRRLYPDDARREGRSGDATVRARVGPNGAVVEVRLDRASDPAFGAACRSLLARSQWSPPLDREGRPVSTWIRYTCRFNADR